MDRDRQELNEIGKGNKVKSEEFITAHCSLLTPQILLAPRLKIG